MPNSKDLHNKRPGRDGRAGNGRHPNSKAQLKTITSSDMAKEYQKKSIEARKANKERRERLAAIADRVAQDAKTVSGNTPMGLDVLRVCMIEAMERGDFDRAAQFASLIAPYEQPKLASQSIDITERNVKDLSDEELKEQAEALGIDYSNIVALSEAKK